MKSILMQSTVQLNEETKHQLAEEVKETLANDANVNNNRKKRNFTAAEMWNRHRKGRSASSMIRKWNLS
ncbi:MAG: hypothetical protein GC171_07550 [Terrimonas sp.]|nr:hypothetical protein [Terrimonas sp.]